MEVPAWLMGKRYSKMLCSMPSIALSAFGAYSCAKQSWGITRKTTFIIQKNFKGSITESSFTTVAFNSFLSPLEKKSHSSRFGIIYVFFSFCLILKMIYCLYLLEYMVFLFFILKMVYCVYS